MNEVFYSSIFGELTKQCRFASMPPLNCVSGYSTKIFTSDSSTGTPHRRTELRGVDRLVQFERRRCNARLQR